MGGRVPWWAQQPNVWPGEGWALPSCTLLLSYHEMTSNNQIIPDGLPPRSTKTTPSAVHHDRGVKYATGARSRILERVRDSITISTWNTRTLCDCKSCSEMAGTNTRYGQVQMYHPWTVWNEVEELKLNNNTAKTQPFLLLLIGGTMRGWKWFWAYYTVLTLSPWVNIFGNSAVCMYLQSWSEREWGGGGRPNQFWMDTVLQSIELFNFSTYFTQLWWWHLQYLGSRVTYVTGLVHFSSDILLGFVCFSEWLIVTVDWVLGDGFGHALVGVTVDWVLSDGLGHALVGILCPSFFLSHHVWIFGVYLD